MLIELLPDVCRTAGVLIVALSWYASRDLRVDSYMLNKLLPNIRRTADILVAEMASLYQSAVSVH